MARFVKLISLILLIVLCGTAWGGDIHKAAANGNTRLVEQLIKSDRSLVNSQDRYGMTALMYAIGRADIYLDITFPIDMVKFLLDNGAHPNIRNKAGKSAIHFLSGDGRAEDYLKIAHLLVTHRVNLNATDNNGSTVLHSLVKMGPDGDSSGIIRYLVSKGANINARDNNDATPLHSAIGAENEPQCILYYVKLLVNLGADVNAKTKRGKTPLAMARSLEDWTMYDGNNEKPLGSGRKFLIDFLKKHGAHP